ERPALLTYLDVSRLGAVIGDLDVLRLRRPERLGDGHAARCQGQVPGLEDPVLAGDVVRRDIHRRRGGRVLAVRHGELVVAGHRACTVLLPAACGIGSDTWPDAVSAVWCHTFAQVAPPSTEMSTSATDPVYGR